MVTVFNYRIKIFLMFTFIFVTTYASDAQRSLLELAHSGSSVTMPVQEERLVGQQQKTDNSWQKLNVDEARLFYDTFLPITMGIAAAGTVVYGFLDDPDSFFGVTEVIQAIDQKTALLGAALCGLAFQQWQIAQLSKDVCHNSKAITQHAGIINQHRTAITQHAGIINQQNTAITQHAGIINKQNTVIDLLHKQQTTTQDQTLKVEGRMSSVERTTTIHAKFFARLCSIYFTVVGK